MTRIICPKCSQPADAEHIVCLKCGALLYNPSLSTVHMRTDPVMLRLRRNRTNENDEMLPEHTISLQIRGMTEKLSFEEGTEVVLGRYDVTASPTPRFDLSHYGARDRGVSREHALLRFDNDQLTITDMRSVNGTSVNRAKLPPNEPRVLRNGDEVTLGTLSIVIRFEPSQDTKIISAPGKERTNDTTAHLSRKGQPDTLPETRNLNAPDLSEDRSSFK